VDRHGKTVDWLVGVADGRIELPSATPLATNPALGTIGEAVGEERLLSRDELSDY